MLQKMRAIKDVLQGSLVILNDGITVIKPKKVKEKELKRSASTFFQLAFNIK